MFSNMDNECLDNPDTKLHALRVTQYVLGAALLGIMCSIATMFINVILMLAKDIPAINDYIDKSKILVLRLMTVVVFLICSIGVAFVAKDANACNVKILNILTYMTAMPINLSISLLCLVLSIMDNRYIPIR